MNNWEMLGVLAHLGSIDPEGWESSNFVTNSLCSAGKVSADAKSALLWLDKSITNR